jgi:exopolysaccharide production protein ExoZ
MNSLQHSPRLLSLQVGRGLAALWVLLFHMDWILRSRSEDLFCGGCFSNGHLGVDFFFVLSGFIITHAHYDDVGMPAQAKRYLVNRFIRIYPLLFIANLVKLGYLALGGFTGGKADPLLVVRSFLMMTSIGNGLLDVSWTLTHEGLFYVVFLISIVLGWRVGLALGVVWTLAILVVATLVRQPLNAFDGVIFSPRNLQFIAGCLACLIVRKRLLVNKGVVVFLGSLLMVVAGLNSAVLIDQVSTCWAKCYWGASFAFLLIGATTIERIHGFTPPRGLLLLGDASFSIYLFHTSILMALWSIAIAMNAPRFLFGFNEIMLVIGFISLGGSVILWYLIERPLLRWAKNVVQSNRAVSC